MEQPAKMDLTSMNISEDKREQLRQLFPEVFTEKAVDFEKLKLVLGGMIDTDKERYGLNWAGKADCFKIIQQPSVGTLKPYRDESVNFDETENIFIEGDNLEVLKLLQKAYYGKVKMICIDPPYNTGNDFIYPDDYSESLDTYLKYTGQVDSEGRKYSTNTEADGRFHTKWINMMYPRLYLARNLMRDDGVIFIHIDDNEVHNLRLIMNEIFGEENLLSELIWDLGTGTAAGHFTRAHEYILCYAKYKEKLSNFKYSGEDDVISERAVKKISKGNPASLIHFPAGIEFEGKDAIFENQIGKKEIIKIQEGKMILKNGRLSHPVTLEAGWAMRNQILSWLDSKETFDSKGQRVTKFFFDKKGVLQYEKERGFINPQSILRNIASTRKGTIDVEDIFGNNIIDFPKPVQLIKYLVNIVMPKNNDLVLDFFAGSATTAHAVIELNKQDNGNRKFIMVQLPEPCDTESEAFKAGYKNIADIGKERIRRVIKKIKEEKEGKLEYEGKTQDLGFKIFKLEHSNFKIWDAKPAGDAKKIEKQLELHVDHIDPKSTQEDILYELLLKSGFDLATKTEKLTLAGKTVYSIADGAMLICLEEKLTKEVINAIAEMTPSRVICLDKGFKDNDQLKANALQIMKSKKVNTFLTV